MNVLQPQLPQGVRLHGRGAAVASRPVGLAEGSEEGRRGGAHAAGPGNRARLREVVDAHTLLLRGCGVRPGRARDLPRPLRLAAGSQRVDRRHRAGVGTHVRRDRVPGLRARRHRGACRERRRAGLQRSHRRMATPTQMLADFWTMREASGKTYDEIAYCYLGDARSNMGRSLILMGAIMGSDVRICGPKELWPPTTSSVWPRSERRRAAPESR